MRKGFLVLGSTAAPVEAQAHENPFSIAALRASSGSSATDQPMQDFPALVGFGSWLSLSDSQQDTSTAPASSLDAGHKAWFHVGYMNFKTMQSTGLKLNCFGISNAGVDRKQT